MTNEIQQLCERQVEELIDFTPNLNISPVGREGIELFFRSKQAELIEAMRKETEDSLYHQEDKPCCRLNPCSCICHKRD